MTAPTCLTLLGAAVVIVAPGLVLLAMYLVERCPTAMPPRHPYAAGRLLAHRRRALPDRAGGSWW